MLILLHGLGSDERDLMGLAPELDPRLRVVTLRAPHPWMQGGYAWFNLEWDDEGIHIDAAQVVASLELLVSEILAVTAELRPRHLFLGGFSQGAVMTLGVTLRRPDIFTGSLLLSGTHVPELFVGADPAVADVPFLIQHGLYDPVLPVAEARTMRDAVTAMGSPVDYREYPMGHEVSYASLRDAKQWLASRAFG
ncbi:phospholipase/carboxylesterase family protein [Fimbriimonas ginsengisoli Gsoil 348]|uniref:Phospholipase/carboxylesterase family protein n=1 Tax=Fimbriimonas ginsengisoli Gsoil 348 TaxID=661478 RepID=A0A068NYR3_FIMGI|nr:phospholipase/carboxylesterase family protein [Fimbriimonas ginsengisoli Gsoil 348]